MAAINKIPDIVGFNHLAIMLDIIKNEEKYAAALKELGDTRDYANRLIEKVGVAEEIEQMRNETKSLVDAQLKEAKAVRDEAEQFRNATKLEAVEKARQTIANADAKMKAAVAREKAAAELMAEAEQKAELNARAETRLQEWEKVLMTREAAVAKREAENEERRRKLMEIV